MYTILPCLNLAGTSVSVLVRKSLDPIRMVKESFGILINFPVISYPYALIFTAIRSSGKQGESDLT